MKELRDTIIKSLLRHAEGHIEKHCANIEVYLTNPVGVGEHPDILEVSANFKIGKIFEKPCQVFL